MRRMLSLASVAMVLLVCALFPHAATAQQSKPVRLIVPWGPGGTSDIIARAVIDQINSESGTKIIIDYKPGANGSIGTEVVARAEADGHTLLLATLSHVTSPSMFKSLSWHPTNDFAGIALLATVPAVGVVSAGTPANTLKEFVGHAKRNPGKLNYLSPGNGTSMHLNTELLNLVAGIDLVSVTYKGTAPGVPDLLANRLTFAFLPVPLAEGHIREGKLKPLFVASTKRISRLPNVPTAAEAGYPDAQIVSWCALLAPKMTPPSRITELNKLINTALATQDYEKRLEAAGASSVTPMSPAELDSMLKAETARFAKLVRDAKITPQ